jgi:flagellar biosynthesis protein FlhF
MNVRKFIAATARDALRKVKETLGPDAIILSNRGIPGGVEIMAVAARDMEMIVPTPEREPGPRRKEAAPGPSAEPLGERPAASRQAPASAASTTSAPQRARLGQPPPRPSPPCRCAPGRRSICREQCRRMRRR